VIRAARGEEMTFPEGPYNVTNMLNVNVTRKPLDDPRVRRALSLALDRRAGDAMMQKVWSSKGFGIAFPAGAPMGLPDEEIWQVPGFGPDVEASRAEAKRLLAEAGVPDLKIKLLNRNAGDPYTSIAVFAIDQMRHIGVTLEQDLVETAPYYSGMATQKFDLAVDANVTVSNDPTEVLAKFLPDNGQNYTGAKDMVLQDLYDRQAAETDPDKRRALVHEFELRLAEQAYILPLFRSINLAAIASNVHGWKIMPSTLVGIDHRNTWKSK
jgi:peptide/nickel transport system substrate-binding protein